MPENFRSLASTLLDVHTPVSQEPAPDAVVEHDQGLDCRDELSDEMELARDVRLFRARVIEAVEAAVETLVTDIAADVLGRELQLEPADIEAIVDRALQRFAAEEPLRVRVHAEDVDRVNCGLPVVPDARLHRGDALIELRNGSIDASFGVRLSSLLNAALR